MKARREQGHSSSRGHTRTRSQVMQRSTSYQDCFCPYVTDSHLHQSLTPVSGHWSLQITIFRIRSLSRPYPCHLPPGNFTEPSTVSQLRWIQQHTGSFKLGFLTEDSSLWIACLLGQFTEHPFFVGTAQFHFLPSEPKKHKRKYTLPLERNTNPNII